MKKFDEAGRLTELRKYNILDTLTEDDYDSITYIASVICDAPIALVAFLDEDRNWFKSHYGTDLSESPRDVSFCQHAIAQTEDILVIEDLSNDSRFSNNPLVHIDPKVNFYAGAPLVSKEGYSLGTVCVLGMEKQTLTEKQQKALTLLSKRVMMMLELRRTNLDLETMKVELELKNKDLEQFAMLVSHDIKSPLTSIILANEMLEANNEISASEENMKFIGVSNKAANKIKNLVDGILSFAKAEHDLLQRGKINTKQLIQDIFDSLKFPKPVEFYFKGVDDCFDFNHTQAERIFLNLINNAVRYNDKKVAIITIDCEDDGDMIKFTISDNGIGISDSQQKTIFNLFQSSTELDSFGIKGTGIGLATVKKIVENNGGEIKLKSELGKGTDFIIRLPKIYNP